MKVPFVGGDEAQKKAFYELKRENKGAYERVINNLKSVEDFGKVKITFNGYWIYFLKPSMDERGEITGKYLFFSNDDFRLYNIAIDEINSNGFYEAKVNSYLLGHNSEYVLCLYYTDDSRKYELARKYKPLETSVKYRYWKSNEDTLNGKYSKEFLDRL